MSIKAVIFDLDGTLYDSGKLPLRLVLADIPGMFTLSAERAARKAMAGAETESEDLTYAELFGLIAARQGISIAEAEHWYRDRYMPNMVKVLKKHYHAREGVTEFLDLLRSKGIKTAVYSDYGMVKEKMDALGIDPQHFDGIFDAPSMGGLKPCQKGFINVCNALGATPEECIMIGDREDTDGGALAAGLKFLKVPKTGPVDFSQLLKAMDCE